MGWFDRDQPSATPPPKEAKYSIDRIKELLDAFGLQRLSVRDPRLKVLISKVTFDALPYMERVGGDKPSGDKLAEMMTTLTMLTETLAAYVKIQNNPDAYAAQGGAEALMAKGFQAVEAYHQRLSSGAAAAQDLVEYNALTGFLTGSNSSI